jgi:hypothetical protein
MKMRRSKHAQTRESTKTSLSFIGFVAVEFEIAQVHAEMLVFHHYLRPCCLVGIRFKHAFGVHERTFQSDAFIAGGFGRYILFLQPDDDAEFSPGGKGSIFFKMVASSSDAEI